MKTTDDTLLSRAIKRELGKVYQADIQAIRNLSVISKKLQSGGKNGLLTIPGNVKIEGSFNYLPKGSIIAFNGPNSPSGWAICNGQNGTPDLRGRFIYGGSSIGKTGGSATHKLSTSEMPTHNHTMTKNGEHTHDLNRYSYRHWRSFKGSNDGHKVLKDSGGVKWTSYAKSAGIHSHTINNNGGNNAHNNMPPYYVLSWIMKL